MLRRLALRPVRRALTLAAAMLVGGGFSAHAALIVIAQQRASASQTAAQVTGFEAQDHFPGAAMLYATADESAPAVGATGTTNLPDLPLPVGAASFIGTTSVLPARPFALGRASAEARARAQQCLTTAVYYEAGSESDDGQRAVAQVVLNRVRHPAFPASVCGVIYQGSDKGSGCQFSYACDGSMARQPATTGWARAARNAAWVLGGNVYAPVGLATHYHTYAVTPAWNRSLVMTAAIGAHFFQRWQGGWGTPAAFHQPYAGIEPLPGPSPREVVVPAVAVAAIASTMPPTSSQPEYTNSGRLKGPRANSSTAVTASALPESTMLDKWKGTGQPLK